MPRLQLVPDNREGGDVRSRIVAAAAALIAAGGCEAATTRAVAAAASVQAPTLYRLFGDKRGLLDAVAEQSLSDYVAVKSEREPDADPIQDLRDGWEAHIALGLAHPAIFALISAAASGHTSPAATAGLAVLRRRVRRVARTGRLRVSEERAVDLIHAMGTGTVLSLLAKPAAERNGLSGAALDAVLEAVLDGQTVPVAATTAGMASGLRVDLDQFTMLTSGERHLLGELLHRIAGGR